MCLQIRSGRQLLYSKAEDKMNFPAIPSCAVIIVTYNSQTYLSTCLRALQEQTIQPAQIVIVDSGSLDKSYLTGIPQDPRLLIEEVNENIGFCVGNNRGYALVNPQIPYILFLNPDAFLSNTFIEQAITLMEQSCEIGALSGLLMGYDMKRQKTTGLIDSSGIFSTWYGCWYDRGQGQPLMDFSREFVPALCGALMFCRRKALESVLLGPCMVMDPTFYMYKEDIDLSLRLTQKGWKLLFDPSLSASHCRGWHSDRSKIDRRWRLLSAKNEMTLYKRLKSPRYLYSALKYFLVKYFNF